MGPSGSGKTTLMDILSGRKNAGKITGEVLMGGNKPSVPFLRRYTGYVEQFGACPWGKVLVCHMLRLCCAAWGPKKRGPNARPSNGTRGNSTGVAWLARRG